MHDLVPAFAIVAIFVGLPWVIMHHITKWKTAATLSNHDEKSLSELHEMARYFEERLETIERIIAADRADPILTPTNSDDVSERRTPRQIAHNAQIADTQPTVSRINERNR